MESYVIDPALVRHLERLFPNRCPDLKETDREIWHHAGKVAVVNYLQQQLAEQERRRYGEES